ncbi:hypothetical protein RRG08_028163 [Elysia crispata]|uniref:Uncharacterized protein n=1 Tax=Elysia crispata TaxID=231223 RepID=A0AAE0YQN0_9GAST|nr:hypothetical protein RRG08_028163 [Elysia crispata]
MGENIFKALDKELISRGVSWSNCISFGCDNASVMLGRLNGVAAHVQKKNPSVHIQGFPATCSTSQLRKAPQPFASISKRQSSIFPTTWKTRVSE